MTKLRALAVPFSIVMMLMAFAATVGGCKKKVTQSQCDMLLDHFADLVVKERFPDAGADTLKSERTRERSEAVVANEFKNCTSEVQTNEFDCAMKAPSSDALIKCLE